MQWRAYEFKFKWYTAVHDTHYLQRNLRKNVNENHAMEYISMNLLMKCVHVKRAEAHRAVLAQVAF